ncbi:hypothetical protein PG993_010902 [Apiospora rasikravindrae]|uniref:Rhodopsin domain-containing protein n=1 Tax=Apiospora rasikravindrae TaxID=990691 RepID=A0ABR1SD08_9PEZI
MSYLYPSQMPPGTDPYSIPAAIAPPGYESNLIDAPSKAWTARLAIYTTLPIAIVLIFLRIYVCLRLRNGLVCEDYLCIAAGESCSITLVYCAAAALIKNSLFLYRRMFSPMPRSKMMIQFGIIFNTISYAVLSLVWLVYSVPHAEDEGWMDPAYTEVMGEQTPKINVAPGAVSTFTDYFAIAVPLSTVSGLKLSLGKKIGVSAVFATGLLACACSTAGLVYRLQNFHATIIVNRPDPYWLSMPAYGLAVAKVNVGIFCACVPVCLPQLKSILETLGQTASAWKQHLLKPKETSSQSPDLEKGQCTAVILLPKMPRVNLTTLLSMLRGSNDPQTQTLQDGVTVTRGTNVESSFCSDLGSVDVDYHRHVG